MLPEENLDPITRDVNRNYLIAQLTQWQLQ